MFFKIFKMEKNKKSDIIVTAIMIDSVAYCDGQPIGVFRTDEYILAN